jgi:hypothetical protein
LKEEALLMRFLPLWSYWCATPMVVYSVGEGKAAFVMPGVRI